MEPVADIEAIDIEPFIVRFRRFVNLHAAAVIAAIADRNLDALECLGDTVMLQAHCERTALRGDL